MRPMGNAGRDQIKNEVLLVVGLVLGRHMVGWLVTHAPEPDRGSWKHVSSRSRWAVHSTLRAAFTRTAD